MSGSPDARSDRFGERYFREEFGLDRLRPGSLPWWSVRFYVILCRRELRRLRGTRFLEAGCGQGWVLARLHREFECWGLDVSEYGLKHAQENAPGAHLVRADLASNLPAEVPRGAFQLVLARYVLEHLADPGDAMARLAELLVPGGALLYAVPDMRSPGLRLKGNAWFGFGDETHVSLLPHERWLELTRQAGLEPVKVFSDGLWDVPYVRGVPRLLQYATLSLPTIVSVALSRPLIPAGWGENLIVLARRGHDVAPGREAGGAP
jgi:SAM-dependent methyltransferase